MHLNSVFAECSNLAIIVIISKVSNYFSKRMSLNSHYYFQCGILDRCEIIQIAVQLLINGLEFDYKWSGKPGKVREFHPLTFLGTLQLFCIPTSMKSPFYCNV